MLAGFFVYGQSRRGLHLAVCKMLLEQVAMSAAPPVGSKGWRGIFLQWPFALDTKSYDLMLVSCRDLLSLKVLKSPRI